MVATSQGTRVGLPAPATDGQHDWNQGDEAEEDEPVGQEDRGAEQDTPGETDQQPSAGSPSGHQGQAADGHSGEQAIRRHRHPHGPGEEGDEGHQPPSRRVAPSSRTTTGRATLTVEATRMHRAPAQKPPPNPIRASSQNTSVVKGG